jgi:hypothetical protein
MARSPRRYAQFLRTRLEPDGISLVPRDLRTWPIEELGPTMQVGSPVTGLTAGDYNRDRPEFRRILGQVGVRRWSPLVRDLPVQYAERGGEPGLEPQLRELAREAGHRPVRVSYDSPATLSGCVADLYRVHLRRSLGLGGSCLVETGRLLAPHRVLERGLVPYWCESAARATVTAAEWWLASSETFDRVTVLPEPLGTDSEAYAPLPQWRSLAGFARDVHDVDRLAARRYPRLPLPRSRAVRVIEEIAQPTLVPPMTTEQAVEGLTRQGALHGLHFG